MMTRDAAETPVRSSSAASHDRTVGALLRYYDGCLAANGDTALGAGWPNERDRTTRFDALLDVVSALCGEREIVLCDLGCGTGELLARIRERGLEQIAYVGADVSGAALRYARAKFPDAAFHQLDVASASDADLEPLRCDVLVAGGLFTVKCDVAHADMWRFMTDTIRRVWPLARGGVAFNVMSTTVDWQRDDLFHVSYDELARFLHGIAGRSIGFRADYGLYEYVAYASKQPVTHRVVPPVAETAAHVPVYRAQLPRSSDVQRYLQTLDDTRLYSNYGPLVRRFAARLASHFGVAEDRVVPASSGTAALVGAILGAAGRARDERPSCIAPAYTFVGTASAIEQCGYRLHLADVAENDWMLDPERLMHHPALARTGLIVVVAPYGRMPAQARWAEFQARTGIPVVIDAAAAFDAISEDPGLVAGPLPVALSFHATKSFATGEGGAVVWTVAQGANDVARALNFGFLGSRVSRGPSINGKMSEYHAAVGLAELDRWERKHAAFRSVARAYAVAAEAAGLAGRIVTAPSVSACYALFVANDDDESAAVRAALDAADIEHRFWYGAGLHREPAFASAAREALDVTERLAPRVVGIPVAPDLAPSAVRRVAGAIASGTTRIR